MFKKNYKTEITNFHYGKFSLFYAVLLFIPSIFYFFFIKLKNLLYTFKILKEGKVTAKVICVGNLTTGGVGKTPVVIELANFLSARDKRVAILSSGYGGSLSKDKVHLVKTYNKILVNDPDIVGDEISLISKKTEDAAIIVSKNRFKGAKFASDEINADVIIMDDGFSNRSLYKDFNIILIDGKNMFGNGFCLPYGPLREPVSEIKRAKKIIFTDKNGIENSKLQKFKNKLKIPHTKCAMKTGKIYNIKTKEIIKDVKDVIAFSAIGQPQEFYDKLKDFNVKKTITYDDHYKYTQKDIDEIVKAMKENEAQAIITTEKDMVKILNFNNIDDFYALTLVVELDKIELLGEFI